MRAEHTTEASLLSSSHSLLYHFHLFICWVKNIKYMIVTCQYVNAYNTSTQLCTTQWHIYYNISFEWNVDYCVGPVQRNNPETLLRLLPRRPCDILLDNIETVFQKEVTAKDLNCINYKTSLITIGL